MCVLPSLSPHFYLFIFDFGPIFMLWTRLPFLWHSVESCTVPPPQTLDACARCSVYGVEMLWRRRALFFTLHLTSLLASAGVRGSPRVVGWHRRLAAASGRLSLALPFLRALSIVTKLFPSFIPNPYVLLPARPSVRVTYPASLPYQPIWRTIQMSMLAYHLVSLVDGWEYPSQ